MPRKDPFAGIRLSEQASSGKLDQRLFSSAPPAPAPPQPARPPKPAEATQQQPLPKPAQPAAKPVLLKPPSLRRTRYDLDDLALYKASFVFTLEELEALEDLKLELRRELGDKVTKNDLIRSALHLLLEDYAANGLRSYARRKVRKG